MTRPPRPTPITRISAAAASGTISLPGGKVVFAKGYGLTNREWNQPNAPDTKFRLGSLTKQSTSMLVMQLVEKGQLKPDAHITDCLPDYPKASGEVEKVILHRGGEDSPGAKIE